MLIPRIIRSTNLSWVKGAPPLSARPDCPNGLQRLAFPPFLQASACYSHHHAMTSVLQPSPAHHSGQAKLKASLESKLPDSRAGPFGGVWCASLLGLACCLSQLPAVSCCVSRYSAGPWLPALFFFFFTRIGQISVLDLCSVLARSMAIPLCVRIGPPDGYRCS